MTPVYAHYAGQEVRLGEVVGEGGEAKVHSLVDNSDLVAKVYSDPAKANATRPRLERLVEMRPRLQESDAFRKRILLPQDLLVDTGTRALVGYTMRRAEGRDLATLYRWYHPKENPNPHATLQVCKYARNVAKLVEEVHRGGLRVADVNSSNFLGTRTGSVYLIDTDSFAIPEDGSDTARGSFNCPVGMAEFLPPELQGLTLSKASRGEHQDRWSLAVLLFLLLARGTHPFDGTDSQGGLPSDQGSRMKRPGTFPYIKGGRLLKPPPRGVKAWHSLPQDVKALLLTTFVQGHGEPTARASASQWVTTLDRWLDEGFHYCSGEHSFPAWTQSSTWCCPECGQELGFWSTDQAKRTEPPPPRLPNLPAGRGIPSRALRERANGPGRSILPIPAPLPQMPLPGTSPGHPSRGILRTLTCAVVGFVEGVFVVVMWVVMGIVILIIGAIALAGIAYLIVLAAMLTFLGFIKALEIFLTSLVSLFGI